MSEFILASAIFARHGVDFANARRLTGWSNATWIAGGLVLRLSTRQGDNRLRREAQLAAQLPTAVGYPIAVESGITNGFEWCLSQEIPGQSLGNTWHTLDDAAQAKALCQLWEKAQAVHTADITKVAGLARSAAWYNHTDPVQASAATQRLVRQGLLTTRQGDCIAAALDHYWQALPGTTLVLNHGDLTLDNAMWHKGEVVSLLDFEFAVLAPVELDLNVLLKAALEPEQELPSSGKHPHQVRLHQAAAALARPILHQSGSHERLLGYAILLEQWLLEDWLAHPEGEGPLQNWEPYRRLLALADSEGGYLKPLL